MPEDAKKPAYSPGSWRVKNDKSQAPGDYEVVRLMSIAAPKGEGKERAAFASIPTVERTPLGIINKVPYLREITGE